MEHIASLLQTVLWVALLSVALWRFHNPIHGLLTALQKRMENGSNIKAGPFEITEQLKPQEPYKQKEKAVSEMAEVLGEQAVEQLPFPELSARRAAATQLKYFQAEDLVLRAIQAEYGATVSRQVTGGSDMGFDGAFVSNGRINIVEVKYVSTPSSNVAKFRSDIHRIAEAISRYGWRNAQIILAIVVERAEDVASVTARLQGSIESMHASHSVIVRCYTFTELQLRFGVAEPANDD